MRAVIAAYDGRCCLCDEEIDEGLDEIVCVDGEWVHAACAESEGEVVER